MSDEQAGEGNRIMRPRRITCPVCGRPKVALTATGRIRQHNDQEATAVARDRGGPFDRVLCTSYNLTPDQVASALAETVTP